MALEKEIIDFLQVYPELYSIIKSRMFMEIIQLISERLISFNDLKKRYPKIDPADLEAILNSLVSLDVISKARASSGGIYGISEKGRALLEKYDKIKRDLLVG